MEEVPKVSLYEQIRAVCSPERIDPYKSGRSEIEALTFYVWNTALCESFYPCLQNLEIGLRNRLNMAICQSFGDPKWYKDSSIVIDLNGQQKVAVAEQLIRDKGKAITPSRVVAELNFGFWTGLFSTPYDAVIWRRSGLLKAAFPFLSKYTRKRSVLADRFGNIRHFRNRVFHHEPIWNLPSLASEHQSILEATGWLDPCLQRVTAALDRFDVVNTDAYRDELKEKLVRACPVESKLMILARKAANASPELVVAE